MSPEADEEEMATCPGVCPELTALAPEPIAAPDKTITPIAPNEMKTMAFRTFFVLLMSITGRQVLAESSPIHIMVDAAHERQVIEGFGGSLAFWGYNADDESLRYAFNDLGVTIVRVPGEVAESGRPDDYRAALQRVTRLAPQARILVAFWQPRSQAEPNRSSWLDEVGPDGYVLKPGRRADWAAEIGARLRLMRNDWGVNVALASPQNEPNFSAPGTLTCRWAPADLADFTTKDLARANVPVPLTAPDLAYLGGDASEARRFAPVCGAVPIVCYHMYDSFREGATTGNGFGELRARQQALGRFFRDNCAGKRLWMTETTGAQWNSDQWHTLGWTARMDEHNKGIAAARYLHSALVDASCNAFLWWGLAYAAPGPSIKDEAHRQKMRDEGLILVEPERLDGVHRFRERTPKYYAFKQFSRFLAPGYVRLETPASDSPLVAAFRSPDARRVVVVLINPDPTPRLVTPRITGQPSYQRVEYWLTDRKHQCESVPWLDTLPAESVNTLVYQADE